MTIGEHAVQLMCPHAPRPTRSDALSERLRLSEVAEEGAAPAQPVAGGVVVAHIRHLPHRALPAGDNHLSCSAVGCLGLDDLVGLARAEHLE
jgi:hypothetical protein